MAVAYGMEIYHARKLNAVAEVNRKLNKLLAESMLDASTLKEMLGKTLSPSLRRRAVTWAIDEKRHLQRRTCRLFGLQPTTYRYALRERTMVRCEPGKELAFTRMRFD